MFRFGNIFLAPVYSLMIKICGLIYNYVYRSKSSVAEENGSNFSANRSQNGSNISENTEGSVFLQSGLISNSSKCQVMSGKNVSGFFEEPKTMKFVVQEMFVGSDDVLVRSDQSLGCEISQTKDSSEQKNLQEFDSESSTSSFYFNLLNGSCSKDEDSEEHILIVENIDQESEEEDRFNGVCSEEEKEKLKFSDLRVERIDHVEVDSLEDQDFSYEVELLPSNHGTTLVADQESDIVGNDILITDQKIEGNDSENWMSTFLDETDRIKQEDLHEERGIDHNLSEKVEDFDDEYIELDNVSLKLTRFDKESNSCEDANKAEELQEQNMMQSEATTFSQERRSCWDSLSDDEDEADVLSEHQHLVQQMKMELKNCRIRGLPTISEECESPKMVEDLKPLKIDQKIEYKDIMEEIQMFYKSYLEKMRKLDILNYQTVHAISFLQLKDSEVFTAGKKKADLVPFVLPKIWPRKVQRIYADPMHKSITEMHRDLELVYVGQLCLSWEILCWQHIKARELLEYDREGNHSYNRAAEGFQQFQVLMQRFMEDEPFQGHRNQNCVRSRCMIRSLLQVPTIRDDCSKTKKERREETDAITLEMLVEIVKESMLIFQEFLFADKKSTNVVPKGIQGTEVDLHDLVNSELLSDIISNLQKKERRIRDHIRSQNCMVNKLKKHQEGRLDREILTSQVELRLVSRVLRMSRLTTDQLVWCKEKLNNISFVGRKVHIEPSFLLFPC